MASMFIGRWPFPFHRRFGIHTHKVSNNCATSTGLPLIPRVRLISPLYFARREPTIENMAKPSRWSAARLQGLTKSKPSRGF
jgi:hypothetical protein